MCRRVSTARSGDPYVDWTFSRFVEILRKAKVYKVRSLRYPEDKEEIYGSFQEKDFDKEIFTDEIFLNPWKLPRCPAVKILIHELSHKLFPSARERHIYSLEKILWKKFTREQKRILACFIPKHSIKRQLE